MNGARRGGFTLVELLTVIAILAILFAMVAVALPGVLERAKIADVESDFRAVGTALAGYLSEHKNSYPPGYGFRQWAARNIAVPDRSDPNHFNMVPYMAHIELYGVEDYYDRFARMLDTDDNENIGLLEFSPAKHLFTGPPLFGLWAGGPYDPDISEGPKTRPYVYAPVNLDQFRRLKAAIGKTSGVENVWDGNIWPDNGTYLKSLVPSRYDAFVLISVGPNENTHGIVEPPDEPAFLASIPDPADEYQALALRTYYLATRDANDNGPGKERGNGILDFDYRARMRQNEAQGLSGSLSQLPDGFDAPGPLIFIQK